MSLNIPHRAGHFRCSPFLLAFALIATAGHFSQAEAQDPRTSPSARASERFDVLIKGGRVLDGTGNAWVRADVGIRDSRIAAVGNLRGASAETVLDATSLYVAPGFIDTHSHAGGALEGRELSGARPLLAQGALRPVRVSGCLHLKSARVVRGECTPGRGKCHLSHRLRPNAPSPRNLTIAVRAVDTGELQKAEGGVTCCALLVEA